MNTTKAQSVKIALVVVLAIGFLAAITNNARHLSSAPSVSQARAAATAAKREQPAVADGNHKPQTRTWPVFELTDLVAYDPFEPTLTAAQRPAAVGAPAAKGGSSAETAATQGTSAEPVTSD